MFLSSILTDCIFNFLSWLPVCFLPQFAFGAAIILTFIYIVSTKMSIMISCKWFVISQQSI